MEKLEEFIIYLLNKNKDKFSTTEDFYYRMFNEILSKYILNNKNLHFSINMQHVLLEMYNELLNNYSIICLIFTNNEKIYICEGILCEIDYFKNMLENNDMLKHDFIVTDIPLIGILDDYETMNKIIDFVQNGYYEKNTLYNKIYYGNTQVAIMDKYLLGTNYRGRTLKDYISTSIFGSLQCGRNDLSIKFFNNIYETCVAWEFDINTLRLSHFTSSIRMNESKQNFIKSKLFENLDEDYKERIKQNHSKSYY